jgi:hypothetical protein
MPKASLKDLEDQAHRHLLAFLKTEVALGLTFAHIAVYQRDLGNAEHYKKGKEGAIKAAETISRFIGRLPDVARRQIETRALKLAEAISTLD